MIGLMPPEDTEAHLKSTGLKEEEEEEEVSGDRFQVGTDHVRTVGRRIEDDLLDASQVSMAGLAWGIVAPEVEGGLEIGPGVEALTSTGLDGDEVSGEVSDRRNPQAAL